MDEVGTLANQHFLEWESRLKHIDEMMAKAHEAHANGPEGSDIQVRLSKIRNTRDELAHSIANARSLPVGELHHVTHPLGGLTGSLETVGLELEKVLATVVGLKETLHNSQTFVSVVRPKNPASL